MNMEDKAQQQTRDRARLIIQVQTGQKTATEAAAELGVSRQTYHQWEKRAMQALVESLEDRPPGRPSLAEDPQKEALREENLKLMHRLAVTEQIADLRGALLRSLEEETAKPGSSIKKKKTESEKSSKVPNA